MADLTLIQTRTYLGNISFTGIEYIATYAAGGGIDRGRTEGECVNAFKRKLGQGLKGQLEVVQQTNGPTEVYLSSISPISPAVFGPFAEYVAAPGNGFHLINSDANVASWSNQVSAKATSENTLSQSDQAKAPLYTQTGFSTGGIKGSAVAQASLYTDYATPSNLTLFMAVYVPGINTTGTLWTTLAPNGTATRRPDLALWLDTSAGTDLKVYSAATQTSSTIAAVSTGLYVFCLQRTAAGALKVYMRGSDTPVVDVTGRYPAGARSGMALFDGYSDAGAGGLSVGALTMVSRPVTTAERNAYMESIYQSVRVT